MTTKLEQIARAIFETWAGENNCDATWEELLRMQKLDGYQTAKSMYALALKEARAAVEVMRVGDAPFFEAMSGATGIRWGFGAADAEIAWTAALDAILTEEKQT